MKSWVAARLNWYRLLRGPTAGVPRPGLDRVRDVGRGGEAAGDQKPKFIGTAKGKTQVYHK
jgi:hypothetical protein